MAEAKALAKAGCKELILIAQDTTYYGYDLYGEYRLPQLLKQLCRIDGIRWVRLMYCYEDRITDELIQTIREEDKICNYLDIPIQHASDRILKAMGRRSTNSSITDKMAKLREQIPDIHVRTTLIRDFREKPKMTLIFSMILRLSRNLQDSEYLRIHRKKALSQDRCPIR